ncbi:MAG: hypothetical protein LBM95_06965 [Lactobacillales bacterium]|jgi:hypothetical protein|nr:hypothetical protein [Lactobacillales bacterium]
MTTLSIRLSEPKDIPSIMEIIQQPKVALMEQGIPQWQNGYPNETDFQKDINNQTNYSLLVGDEIIATATLLEVPEPTYERIYDGAWQPSTHYATIHRLALKNSAKGQGYAEKRLYNF